MFCKTTDRVNSVAAYRLLKSNLLIVCSAWDDPEFVEAVLRLVLSRLVDSQLGIFAMFNFAVSIYAVGALTTKARCSALAQCPGA